MRLPTVTLLEAGYCHHPEHVILRNRVLRPMRFPALCALIEHPTAGPILYDTGYSSRSSLRRTTFSLPWGTCCTKRGCRTQKAASTTSSSCPATAPRT